MAKPAILLTGCGGSAAQNVVWSLQDGPAAYRLVGAECDHYRVLLTTGFDRKYLIPRAGTPRYLDALNEIIEAERVELVHAQPDAEVEVLSANRGRVRARLLLPADDTVRLCLDKYALTERLRGAGVPTARHVLVRAEADLATAMETVGPRVWLRAVRGAGGRCALPVEKLDHARMWIDYWGGWGEFVAEEYLPGRNLAWQAVYRDGALVGSIAWERVEYIFPRAAPSGVTGTASVATPVDDADVHRIGRQAVGVVDPRPTGVFGVDLKGDRYGTPCVTEINAGRFFTPSFMYARGGYNLVRLFVEVALGGERTLRLPTRARVARRRYWLRGIDLAPVMRTLSPEGSGPVRVEDDSPRGRARPTRRYKGRQGPMGRGDR